MAKQKGNTSSALNSAKKAKNDEFYTQFSDIAEELRHYRDHFRDKIVFCNCDDPYESNFFKYFALNFNTLGLKKLIATCYAGSSIANTELSLFDHESPEEKTTRNPHKIEISEVPVKPEGGFSLTDVTYMLRNTKNVLTRLKGDGDFRSQECVELMKQADVVVTNPPLSLFREYVAQLMEYEKSFVIIGNVNAITYKEIFPYIKENRIWLGESINSGDRKFRVPDYYPLDAAGCGIDKDGYRFIRVKGVRWFTNIQTKTSKRLEELYLYKHYTPSEYPKYDNYDAIDVSKVAEIPVDHEDRMGVPVTFLDKYNPTQFEILGLDRYIEGNKTPNKRFMIDGKEIYARIVIKKRKT